MDHNGYIVNWLTIANEPTRMKRISKKPTSDHTYRSIRWHKTASKLRKGGVHARSTAESNINIRHTLPPLDPCCEYVGDRPDSPAGLTKYAGSKYSFSSYALYDDRLLDKLLATEDCFLNLGRTVNLSPNDRVVESGERGFPGCNGVNPAFMLKLLLCACELPGLGDCDTEIDGTDICDE